MSQIDREVIKQALVDYENDQRLARCMDALMCAAAISRVVEAPLYGMEIRRLRMTQLEGDDYLVIDLRWDGRDVLITPEPDTLMYAAWVQERQGNGRQGVFDELGSIQALNAADWKHPDLALYGWLSIALGKLNRFFVHGYTYMP